MFGADRFDVNICQFEELAETIDVVFYLGRTISGLNLVFTETRPEDLDLFN